MAPSEAFTRLKELGAQWASSTAAVKPALDALHDALPSCVEIERAFGLFCRRVDDVNDDASPPCSPQVDHLGRVSCACAGCARWKSYVAGDLRPSPPWPSYPQYEVLTREHVAALAAYLRARAAHYDAARLSEERVPASRDEHPRRVRRPLRVLEVGAGDGRLARYLRVAIQALDTDEARRRYPSPAVTRDEGEGGAGGTGSDDTPTVEIIATDNDARALARGESSDAVIIVDALHAIAAAGDTSHGGDLGIPPCDVVLACWQPMGVDWTATMRAAPGVMDAYRRGAALHPGEVDDGICGEPWLTWGYDGGGEPSDDEETEEDREAEATEVNVAKHAPYTRDGFERVDLAAVSAAGQVCRTDERWRRGRQSRTVSFRRMRGIASDGG